MKRIEPATIVENKEGQRGVTCPDIMSCCSDDQTPVVYDGDSFSTGTSTDTLKVIGPENAQADPGKCGAGRGADCCIFITCGAKGFVCERHTDMRYSLIFRADKMTAQRQPTNPYPACQFSDGGAS